MQAFVKRAAEEGWVGKFESYGKVDPPTTGKYKSASAYATPLVTVSFKDGAGDGTITLTGGANDFQRMEQISANSVSVEKLAAKVG